MADNSRSLTLRVQLHTVFVSAGMQFYLSEPPFLHLQNEIIKALATEICLED